MEVTGAPGHLSMDAFLHIIHESLLANDDFMSEASAVKWADGFTIPDKHVKHDTEEFDHQDIIRLHRLTYGMEIPTTPEWINLPTPPPLRQKYVAVHPAVDLLKHLQWMKGQVIFILTSVAVLIAGIHFSAQHWALKSQTASGRDVADLSNPDTPDHKTINGSNKTDRDYISMLLNLEYGAVYLPTLRNIVIMILIMWKLHNFDSSELVLFKHDLSGAYNLLDFHPSSIPKLAFALANGITALHITGIFGWSGTPYAFQVISRTLQDVCNDLLFGLATTRWYIDDCLGVSSVHAYPTAIRVCQWVITTLLGPSANNKKKEQLGRRLDMLG
eukprot:gene43017-53381_t